MKPNAPKSTPPASLFPFLDLKAQYGSIRVEVLGAIQRVMESQHFILGEEVDHLEEEIAKICGCEHAIGCASGSDALLLALMAIGVEPDDEVITTPFTFGATAGAIARLRARPVFVDIDPETYNLDPVLVARSITRRTRAILPVHLFGLMSEMDALLAIARFHKIPVVEDAAQSILAADKGRPAGSLGFCGCFSFFPSKNLGGAGDGGMITTQSAELAEKLKILRAHGCRRKYQYETVGMNSRLDALQAAILRAKLPHLSDWTDARRANAGRYRELFAQRGLESWVILPVERTDRFHVYNQFVVRVAERDLLQAFLLQRGIPTEIYYPSPLHLQPAFSQYGYRRGDLPNAEQACHEVLALPIFPEIRPEQQLAVVASIAAFYSEHRRPVLEVSRNARPYNLEFDAESLAARHVRSQVGKDEQVL
jgi:dTDP-4-amino-4,6-dideoxygalactose transaminase